MRNPIHIVRDWWGAWVRLLSTRESAFGWALFRFGIGSCLLYSLVSIAAAGLVDLLWVDIAFGGYRVTNPVRILLVDVGPARPVLVNTIFAITFVGAVGVALGAGGRIVTFITLQGYLALMSINGDTIASDDMLMTNALWLLVLCDASQTLSIRCRLRTGRWLQEVDVAAWGRYLAILQLLVLYTFAGLNKTNTNWVPWGEMNGLYLALMDPNWLRFKMDWVANVYPLTQVGSAVTWVFETFSWLMLPVLYFRNTRDRGGWMRAAFNRWDLRKLFLSVGVCLHLGIFLTLDVGPFSLVSLTFYVCFFRPEEVFDSVKGLGLRLQARGRRANHAPDQVQEKEAY